MFCLSQVWVAPAGKWQAGEMATALVCANGVLRSWGIEDIAWPIFSSTITRTHSFVNCGSAEHVNINDLSAYQYELPEELIAQKPVHPRDSSRLLVLDRKKGAWE